MFKMMVVPWRDAHPYLGLGTYYTGVAPRDGAASKGLVGVTLHRPLLLNARQIRMLVQTYGTNSADRATGLDGAWTLRRDILKKGHDGIIAIDDAAKERSLTLVALVRPGETPGGMDRHRASEASARATFIQSYETARRERCFAIRAR
jgi:hypothetical protein